MKNLTAEVAELADAHDSNSCSFGSEGSIPSFGTNIYLADYNMLPPVNREGFFMLSLQH